MAPDLWDICMWRRLYQCSYSYGNWPKSVITDMAMCTSISIDFVNPIYKNKWVCLCFFKWLHVMMFLRWLGAHFALVLKRNKMKKVHESHYCRVRSRTWICVLWNLDDRKYYMEVEDSVCDDAIAVSWSAWWSLAMWRFSALSVVLRDDVAV
jgi:hypothetical protein